jgi:hypothetical protein
MAGAPEKAFLEWMQSAQAELGQAQREFFTRMQPGFAAFAEAGQAAATLAQAGLRGEVKDADVTAAMDAASRAVASVFPGQPPGDNLAAAFPFFEKTGPLPFMFGPGQDIKPHLFRLQEAMERYQRALHAYTRLCAEFAPEVAERFRAGAATAGPELADNPEKALEGLFEAAEAHYEDFASREDYRLAATELFNASVALMRTFRNGWDATCDLLELPSRAQMEVLRAENAALAARIEALEAGLQQPAPVRAPSTVNAPNPAVAAPAGATAAPPPVAAVPTDSARAVPASASTNSAEVSPSRVPAEVRGTPTGKAVPKRQRTSSRAGAGRRQSPHKPAPRKSAAAEWNIESLGAGDSGKGP